MADAPLPAPSPGPLRVERIDVGEPVDGRVLVRLAGRWTGRAPGGRCEPLLAVPNGRRVLRFSPLEPHPDAEAHRPARDPSALAACYSLPEMLLPALAAGLSLELEGAAVPLPPPASPERDAEDVPPDRVVGRAVLAERRTRRAELAEEAQARRAAQAEQAVGTLEADLDRLRLRLQRVDAERDAALARGDERERALRAAVQRAHAEQRRREEAMEEADRRLALAQDEARGLRERLELAMRVAGGFGEQVEGLRRRAAEADNAVGSATAARRRAERQASQAAFRLQRLEATRARAVSTSGRLGAAVAGSGLVQDELAALRRDLARAASASNPVPPPYTPPGAGLRAALEAEQRLLAAGVPTVGRLHRRRQRDGRCQAALAQIGRGLAEARQTIAQARVQLEELEGTGDELRARIEAEQAWRASAQTDLEQARAAAATAEEAVGMLQRELDRRAQLERRARALVDDLHQQVRALREDTSERDGAEGSDRRLAAELVASANHALDEAEQRLGEAVATATEVQEELERERRSRRRLEGELERHAEGEARAERRAAALGAHLASVRRASLATSPGRPTGTAGEREPWLPRGLRLMADDDSGAAARLLLGLLPAQGLSATRALDYDIDLAEAGWHAVKLSGGRADVRPLPGPRQAGEADFRLALDAAALVELLAQGGSRRLRRRHGVRISRARLPGRALRALRPAPLGLSTLADAGVWADPCLCFRALTYLVDPAWTRGHSFTVAQEVERDEDGAWYVRIADGAPPVVTRTPPPGGATATIRLSRAAFQHLLGGRPPSGAAPVDKAVISGDVHALSLLAQWTEWAQGIGEPGARRAA